MDDPLPIPSGTWDAPQPVTALPESAVDLVAVLTQFGHRLPKLITAFDELRRAIPQFTLAEINGTATLGMRGAMAKLCREPAEILLDLAALCEQQGTPPCDGGLIEETR